jgi:O-antigen/teichoic acid export membrane protein
LSLAKRAATGIVWAQIGKGAETVIGFVLSVIIVRKLGPSAFGEYGLLLGLVNFGILLSSLGFPYILGKYVPRLVTLDDRSGAGWLLWQTLVWRTGLSLGLVAVAVAFSGYLSQIFHLPSLTEYLWPLALLFVSTNLFGLSGAFFSAILQTKRLTAVGLFLNSVNLALTGLFFVTIGVTVRSVLYASSIAMIAGLALSLVMLRGWFSKRVPPSLSKRSLLRYGRTIWLTGFASYGLDTQSDILLLGYLLPDQVQIGLYKAAVMPVERLISLLTGGWANLVMPVLSEANTAQGLAGVRRVWTGYIKLVMTLGVPLLMLLVVTGSAVLTLLYTDQYQNSTGLLQLYCVYHILGFTVGRGVGTVMLQTLNLEGLAFRLRLGASALNICLSLALIPKWGAAGAIAATATANLLQWLVETVITVRRYRLDYPWGFLGKMLSACLSAAAIVYLIPSGGWVRLAVQIAAYGLVFCGVLYAVKPLDEHDRGAIAHINPGLARVAGLFCRP